MGLDSLPEPVQIQAFYLHRERNNIPNWQVFGDKKMGGRGVVGTMIEYCQSRYGAFNEKHFIDIVRKGLRSKHYNHYKEDQA